MRFQRTRHGLPSRALSLSSRGRRIQKICRPFLALLFLAHTSHGLSSKSESLVPAMCYLHQFKPDAFPWQLEDCLNFEEVFKNFQYFEAKWNQELLLLQITKSENGKRSPTETYRYDSKTKRLVPLTP